jgi:hypothetical protein
MENRLPTVNATVAYIVLALTEQICSQWQMDGKLPAARLIQNWSWQKSRAYIERYFREPIPIMKHPENCSISHFQMA